MILLGAHDADLPGAIGTRAGLAGSGGAVPMLACDWHAARADKERIDMKKLQ